MRRAEGAGQPGCSWRSASVHRCDCCLCGDRSSLSPAQPNSRVAHTHCQAKRVRQPQSLKSTDPLCHLLASPLGDLQPPSAPSLRCRDKLEYPNLKFHLKYFCKILHFVSGPNQSSKGHLL